MYLLAIHGVRCNVLVPTLIALSAMAVRPAEVRVSKLCLAIPGGQQPLHCEVQAGTTPEVQTSNPTALLSHLSTAFFPPELGC